MKKTLVRIPQWLGDAVVSTAFLSRLKQKFPTNEISVVCENYLIPIFESHPAVTHVFATDYKNGGTVFSLAKKLRLQKFDEVYILPRSFRTALESTLAFIPHRIGFNGDLRNFLLSEVIPYDKNLFYPHRYLKLLCEEKIDLKDINFYFPKKEISPMKLNEVLGISWSEVKKPILGLAPLSIAPSRTWPSENFVSLAQKFIETYSGTVLLFGSSSEFLRIQTMTEKIGASAFNLAGKLDWAELGWIMSQLQFFVGNDSGLMHVATSFDVPGVIVFGASDPTWALFPVSKLKPVQNKSIHCVPCLRNHCVRVGSGFNECLNSILVEEIWKKLPAF